LLAAVAVGFKTILAHLPVVLVELVVEVKVE
jgi:hypothetical protein